MQEIVNAIFYVQRGGIPWRMLPRCFPPRQDVYGWFATWHDAGDDFRSRAKARGHHTGRPPPKLTAAVERSTAQRA